ncbi:hypothetical protein BDR26DRAFT_1003570, partial [Obelidium mucronatum]
MQQQEDANTQQLRALGVPAAQWTDLFAAIDGGRLGAGGALFRDGAGVVRTAAHGAPVLVFAHAWLFGDRAAAERHLAESPLLRDAAASLVRRTTRAPCPATAGAVLRRLFRIAVEFEVKSATLRQKLYAVSLDDCAPCEIPFAQNPLLAAGVFVDARSNKSYTLLWQADPATSIPKGTAVTRGYLPCMPDYSSTEYWKYHYATSNESTTFDWFLPWSVEFANLLKSVLPALIPSSTCKTAITVLNVGCGNSTATDGMMKDRVADMVINFDISRDAVQTISKAHSKSLTSKTPGLQQFAVFDGALSSGFPFRKTTSSGKRFDWAFDKGTTDGLLRSSMDIVRQLWSNMAQVTDTVVWVSLGRPENRIFLIEDEIGFNWEVDQCLQIDGNDGLIKTHYIYVCKQRKGE